MSFVRALTQAHQALRDAGYPGVQLEVHISKADVDAVSREFGFIQRVIHEATNPDPTAPARPGARLFAVVADVRVYVKE